jgi:hypothetical protein
METLAPTYTPVVLSVPLPPPPPQLAKVSDIAANIARITLLANNVITNLLESSLMKLFWLNDYRTLQADRTVFP